MKIGNEFSSHEPEPAEEYIELLNVAYKAAHDAFPGVSVGHAAFLTTPVDMDVNHPGEYDRVWAATKRNDKFHELKDLRTILDHPQYFDVINIHNPGDPYEVEHIMKWLKYETGKRGYSKKVIISDTLPTSYIGWGPATTCKGKKLGILIPPAREEDRCRLADYFTKLVRKDRETLAWTRAFVAADHVQRTLIAAEQGIVLINLSFTTDLPLLTGRLLKASAGISAWGGAVVVNHKTGVVSKRYPLFYAIKQLMSHFNAYDSIQRIQMPDDHARVYVVKKKGKKFWVAWRNPKGVFLPVDGQLKTTITLQTGTNQVTIEPVITKIGQAKPKRTKVASPAGITKLELTHTPIYIFPG